MARSAHSHVRTRTLCFPPPSIDPLPALLGAQPALVSALTGLTNITILAPSNAAFAAFLNTTAGKAAAADPSAVAALLTYHVLNGTYYASAFTSTPLFIPSLLTNTSYANVTGGQVVEAAVVNSSVVFTTGVLATSTVTTANVNFTGGVVHVIDSVLTIPESDADTAVAAGLTSLAGALTATNLVTTVDDLSDVTIFAPTNGAFQAIGSALGTLNTSTLASILEYHVVQGVVGYSTILSNTTLKTVNGANLTITLEGGSVYVNSAKVVIPNVLVANGVVHVIDEVLNPSASTLTPNPSTTTVAFAGASSVSTAPFTSGIAATSTIASSATASAASSASAAGAARAMETGAVGLAALFGGAALLFA
jgi:uncharacterized surface protein with fasciclin (FAS1) repeats